MGFLLIQVIKFKFISMSFKAPLSLIPKDFSHILPENVSPLSLSCRSVLPLPKWNDTLSCLFALFHTFLLPLTIFYLPHKFLFEITLLNFGFYHCSARVSHACFGHHTSCQGIESGDHDLDLPVTCPPCNASPLNAVCGIHVIAYPSSFPWPSPSQSS